MSKMVIEFSSTVVLQELDCSLFRLLRYSAVVSWSRVPAPVLSYVQILGQMKSSDYATSDISQTLKSRGEVFDLLVDNVSRPYDLYKASDYFLRDNAPLRQSCCSGRFVASGVVPRWLVPRILGGGKHSWHLFLVKNSINDHAQIAQWVKEGKLNVMLDFVFDFQDRPKAIERLRKHRVRGKVVINVTERPPSSVVNPGS
jgi:NADPH:quinone reductase-like Zn-dependent oxidoreductase